MSHFDLPKKTSLQWRCENCIACTNCDFTGHDAALDAHGALAGSAANKFSKQVLDKNPEGEVDLLANMDTSAHAWASGWEFCGRCRIKRENKEYCPVCLKLWGPMPDRKKSSKKKRGGPAEEEAMIECQCGFWVHLKCDPQLTAKAINSYEDGRQYLCPRCQRKKRNKNLVDFVNALIKEDRNGYFYFPVNTELFPNYLKVVKKPMCLE